MNGCGFVGSKAPGAVGGERDRFGLRMQSPEKLTQQVLLVNATVLVVDDEERIRSSLRGLLSEEGFRVVDTGHAPGVMEIVAREKPAVVLLDIWMPEDSSVWELGHRAWP